MALTRKFLSAMGIESDKVDEIITAHADTVDGLKAERDEAKRQAEANKADADKYKSDADKLASVQKELDELKNANGKNPFEEKYNEQKAEYDKLKAEFDEYKADIDAKAKKQEVENAYKALLKEAGISEKRIDSVLKVSDISDVELDKDGKIKDAADLTKKVKEEWSDFIVTEHSKGADTPKPLENNGGDGPKGESRAAKIAAQYHANLYGESKKEV